MGWMYIFFQKPSDIIDVFQRATPWRQPPDAFH